MPAADVSHNSAASLFILSSKIQSKPSHSFWHIPWKSLDEARLIKSKQTKRIAIHMEVIYSPQMEDWQTLCLEYRRRFLLQVKGREKRCTNAINPRTTMHQNLVMAPKKEKEIMAVPQEQP